jgi:lanthionine synthetase-like protein
VLYDPHAHEALDRTPWDEARARSAIAEIVADAEEWFEGEELWPVHPRDANGVTRPVRTLYLGAAGVIWALDELRRVGAAELHREYGETAASLHRAYVESPEFQSSPVPSLWMGESGILLVADRLSPNQARRDLLLGRIRENAGNETNELMWGSPGTMLAAHFMLERTGDESWGEAWRESAQRLLGEWQEDGLWTQRLYGRVLELIGPAHGLAGNIFVLARGAHLLPDGYDAELARRATAAVEGSAIREHGLANWPRFVGEAPPHRVQWCHGAAGIVTSLAGIVPDELLLPAAELTWRAGPLVKGASLCHGTAGNGYAFLKLFGRTSDPAWLERARAFAMHAIGQVERERERHGRGRYTLWTGDLGTALYLWDCIAKRATVPTFDMF